MLAPSPYLMDSWCPGAIFRTAMLPEPHSYHNMKTQLYAASSEKNAHSNNNNITFLKGITRSSLFKDGDSLEAMGSCTVLEWPIFTLLK